MVPPTEEAHDHKTADFVLLLGNREESLGECHREDVGVAVAYEGDGGIKHPLLGADEHAAHRESHQDNADDEEPAGLHDAKEERTGEGTNGTEDEVERGGEGCIVESHTQTLHEELGSCGVGTHVDADMAHDGKERQEHDGLLEQCQAVHERRRLAAADLLVDRSCPKQGGGDDANNEVDQEEHTPIVTERWDDLGSAPHSEVRSHERSDGLDELSEGKCGCKVLVTNHEHSQGVNTGLHQGVADAEEREGHEHHGERLAKQGDEQRNDSDNKREEHGLLAADLVHQHACRNTEDEEPEEHERREHVGHRVGELEIFLDVVGCDADQIDEAHAEEGEHHRDDGKSRGLFHNKFF